MDGTVEKMDVDIDLDIKDVEKLLPLRKSENNESELIQDGFVKDEYPSNEPQQNTDVSEKLVTILGSVTEDQVKEFTIGAENIAECGQMIATNQMPGPDAPQQQIAATPEINSLRSHRKSVAEPPPEVAEKPGRSERVDRVDKPETRSERTRSERLERSARIERAPVERVVEKERKLSKNRHFWPKEDVLKMIDVWRERVVELRSSRKNGHIYTEMSVKLGTMGVEVEAIEIRIKINNLTQKYKSEKAKGGTSDWEFFAPVHTVFELLKAANPDLPDDSPVDTEDSKLNLWEEIDKKMEVLDTQSDKDYVNEEGDINNDKGDGSDKADNKSEKNDKIEKNEKIPKTTTMEQYKMMVDFINEHKIMLKERRSVAENKDVENLWNELGVILNTAENAPNRDAKKWRRTFIEWRSKTRNKLKGKDGINNESFTPEEKVLLELCARIVSEDLQTDGEDGVSDVVNDPNIEKPENRIEKLEKTEKILKTTAEQYKQIVDFINVHKIMVKERRSLAENKDVEALWNELSLLLNKTENGANRDGRKWRRYFIEWRSKTRNKLKGLKDGINSETLSQEEKDLLELCARIASEDLQAELEDAVSDKSVNDVALTDASGDIKPMMMPSQMFQSPNMATPNMHLMGIPPNFQSTPQKHPTLTQRTLAQSQKLQKVSSTSKTRPAPKPKTASSAKATASAQTASASRSVSPTPSSASSDDDESPVKNSNNKRAKKSIQHRILDEIVKANKLAEKELEESRKFSAKAHHLEEKRVKITEYFMQRSLAIQETLVTFMDYHHRGGSF